MASRYCSVSSVQDAAYQRTAFNIGLVSYVALKAGFDKRHMPSIEFGDAYFDEKRSFHEPDLNQSSVLRQELKHSLAPPS